MWEAIMNFFKNLFVSQPDPEQPEPPPAKPNVLPIVEEKPATPAKVIPLPVKPKIDLVAEMIGEGRKFLHVNEKLGKNRSKEIDMFNKAMGIALGSPWCMSKQQWLIDAVEKKFKVVSRVFRSAHCVTVWNKTPKDLKSQTPAVGSLIIWNHKGTSNGHVGLILEILDKNNVLVLEGNTGPGENVERNGDGVYIKRRSIKGSGSMVVLGFVKIWDEQFVEAA
jgi:hypothetical protein